MSSRQYAPRSAKLMVTAAAFALLCNAALGSELYKRESMISGVDFELIQRTLPEFNERNLKLIDYKISVWTDGKNTYVEFYNLKHRKNILGSDPKNPSYVATWDVKAGKLLHFQPTK